MTPDNDIMAHPEEIMGSDRSQAQKDEVQMIPVTGVISHFSPSKYLTEAISGRKDVGSWFPLGTQTSVSVHPRSLHVSREETESG